MATRKKIERPKNPVPESFPPQVIPKVDELKVQPADWVHRKGTTSAGQDGISTDERIIFLRDDMMQFINNQNRQMAQVVKLLSDQVARNHNFLIGNGLDRVGAFMDEQREVNRELDTQIHLLRVAVERRWWKQAWAWIKRAIKPRPR